MSIKYTGEFKQEALRLCEEQGVTAASEKLGIRSRHYLSVLFYVSGHKFPKFLCFPRDAHLFRHSDAELQRDIFIHGHVSKGRITRYDRFSAGQRKQ